MLQSLMYIHIKTILVFYIFGQFNALSDEYAKTESQWNMQELVQRKVFDGRTNDIKEEKTWNEHINILLDKDSYNAETPLSHVPTKTKFLE